MDGAAGTAILLSGVSSAGKSRIARALPRGLGRVAVYLPGEGLELPRPAAALDDLGRPDLLALEDRLAEAYLALLVALALRGFHAIGETFLSSPDEVARSRSGLATVPHLLVRVTAPGPVVEQRERERGNRYAGTAAAQLDRDAPGDGFDLVVDTDSTTPEASAALITAAVERAR